MAWGARQWLKIIPEATWATFDSGATPVYIRLAESNAFTYDNAPQMHEIRDAAGGNRRIQEISSRTRTTARLRVPLYHDYASALLAWATTLTSNDLSSYTIDFSDPVRTRRLLGAKVKKLTIECAANTNEGMLMATLDLIAQKSDASNPTFSEPAFSVYPTSNPYTFQESSTGFKVGTTQTKYDQFKCEIDNMLAATFDETSTISNLTYCGRNTSFESNFQYLASTHQTSFEARSALDCEITFTKGGNSVKLEFHTKNLMVKHERILPLDDIARQSVGFNVFYDNSGSTDFGFTVT